MEHFTEAGRRLTEKTLSGDPPTIIVDPNGVKRVKIETKTDVVIFTNVPRSKVNPSGYVCFLCASLLSPLHTAGAIRAQMIVAISQQEDLRKLQIHNILRNQVS